MRDKSIQVKHIDTCAVLVCMAMARVRGEWTRIALETAFAHIPVKVMQAKLEKMCDAGLIEFGVNVWSGWVSPAGFVHLHSVGVPVPAALRPLIHRAVRELAEASQSHQAFTAWRDAVSRQDAIILFNSSGGNHGSTKQ